MPSARKSSLLPPAHTTLHVNGGTLRFYLGDCLEVLQSFEPGVVSVVVTSPPYNLGIRYRTYRRRHAAAALSGLDERLDQGGGAGTRPARVALPECRRQAHRPLDGDGRGPGRPRPPELQNTIHWIKSIAIDQDAAGAGAALTAILPSATTSRSTARASSTTATSSSSTSRHDGRTPLDRRRSA